MEVFRDLSIRATADQMVALVAEVERSVPSGWTRDRAAESKAKTGTLGHGQPYCFGCRAEGQRAAALVILLQKDDGTFRVSNIVPASKHQLAHAEYNAISTPRHSSVGSSRLKAGRRRWRNSWRSSTSRAGRFSATPKVTDGAPDRHAERR
jgi:hypothetical protein